MYIGIGTDTSVPHHDKVRFKGIRLKGREPNWDDVEVLERCLVDARYRGTHVAQVPVEVLEAVVLFLSLPPEVDF